MTRLLPAGTVLARISDVPDGATLASISPKTSGAARLPGASWATRCKPMSIGARMRAAVNFMPDSFLLWTAS